MQNKPLTPEMLDRARSMRHDPAPAEQKLWRMLRSRQLDGLKFRRQHVIEPYIADFYCHELSLVIELDGESHGERDIYDARRTRRLERDGKVVLRFTNPDVHRHLGAVLETILQECERITGGRPSPLPSPGGRGGKTDQSTQQPTS